MNIEPGAAREAPLGVLASGIAAFVLTRPATAGDPRQGEGADGVHTAQESANGGRHRVSEREFSPLPTPTHDLPNSLKVDAAGHEPAGLGVSRWSTWATDDELVNGPIALPLDRAVTSSNPPSC